MSEITDVCDAAGADEYLYYDEEDGFYSSGKLRLEENQKAWKVYYQQALNDYGHEKIESIMHRYFNHSNNPFCHIRPFQADRVEKIEVGAAYITIEEVRKRALGQDLSKMSDSEIGDCLSAINPHPYLGKHIDEIGSQPTQEDALYAYDEFLAQKEALQLFQLSEQMTGTHAYEEMMTKLIVPRIPREGTVFPVPVGNGEICYFTVHKIVVTGEGVVALAMKPITEDGAQKNPPFLVFRAAQMYYTGLDALSTLVNNCQWALGLDGYKSAKEKLQNLMDNPEFRSPDQRIQVMGFSLGGVHTQRFLCDFVEDVEEAVFFNDLAIDEEAADAFAKKVNNWSDDHPPVKFTIYRVIDDHYSFFGDVHLGRGCSNHPSFDLDYVEIESKIDFPTGGYLHTYQFFSDQDSYNLKKYQGEEADAKLHFSRQSNFIRFFELLRKTLGSFILQPVFSIFRFISKHFFGRRVDRML